MSHKVTKPVIARLVAVHTVWVANVLTTSIDIPITNKKPPLKVVLLVGVLLVVFVAVQTCFTIRVNRKMGRKTTMARIG